MQRRAAGAVSATGRRTAKAHQRGAWPGRQAHDMAARRRGRGDRAEPGSRRSGRAMCRKRARRGCKRRGRGSDTVAAGGALLEGRSRSRADSRRGCDGARQSGRSPAEREGGVSSLRAACLRRADTEGRSRRRRGNHAWIKTQLRPRTYPTGLLLRPAGPYGRVTVDNGLGKRVALSRKN